MIIRNNFEKSFGPVGAPSGVILFITGLIVTCFYFSGVILILIGAFVGFSSTSTFIDYENKRVRFSNNLFGIIRTGKWMNIDHTMKIGISHSDVTWRTFSRGNRTLDITGKEVRIILLDSKNSEIMPLKKADSYESAKTESEEIGNRLGLSWINKS